MLLSFSYPLSEATPFYKTLRGPRIERLYDLSKGDACNSFYLTTSNHAGTHVDAPNHFNPDGRRIAEYELSELVFTRPALLDVQVAADELILPEHLESCAACRGDCDFLFVRTGFGKHRSNAETYIEHNPGFSATAADFLMQRFPDSRHWQSISHRSPPRPTWKKDARPIACFWVVAATATGQCFWLRTFVSRNRCPR